MKQNGDDNEGILGFLEKDIRKCVRQCASKKCFYCKKTAASIKCHKKSCKRYFHLICGHKNNFLFEFIDQYVSYCHEHHGIVDDNVKRHNECCICWELLNEYNPITSIPSCCNEGWFHVRCFRISALSAGYLFKCLLCGYKNDGYLCAMRKRGIYIPDRDASWELESNAFASLYSTLNDCDATECLCPKGRSFTQKWSRSRKWFLLKCTYCGSKAIHVHCNGPNSKSYICEVCTMERTQSVHDDECNDENEALKTLCKNAEEDALEVISYWPAWVILYYK